MNFLFANKLAFYIVDKTHSGRVSCDEVMNIMIPLVGSTDPTTIDCMRFFFSLCDVDNDNALNQKEFEHFMWCYNKCCEPKFVKIKADLVIVLFIEIFRAIDSDMNGTVSCSEIAHTLSKLEESNVTMFGYKDMFEDIRDYAITKGPQTELTEFEFLCIAIKPEILFLHLEAKYNALFKKLDNCQFGYINAKDLVSHIARFMFPRGCETKNALDLVISIITSTTQSEKIKIKQFGFLIELLKDVSRSATYFTNPMLYEAMFRLIDNNSNGELDGEELVLLIETIKLSSKKKEIVMKAIKAKSTITYSQFIDIMHN
ncbi:EF-hand calcium-binding domain containing protein [Entamoeba histolytica HM-1:IMSS-B]|uniref:EF-hand calcium-binding domain containing protein n=6 Tax=Entamoeba histolytica TaxID=5759 RepID=C4LWH6_ENTH1|nr:EF-hand calcium-binding domain containing protein [Entamoeba histolytica HM-1:IMSS]EMD47660.1 EF hand calcium-binding domain containing protein [Entamoeba histolytica KU27]EMH74360.1 EF-hand calcium-binding domain containing protein [Entamoeba histolytica HM-1:IMSS-B]EMS11763.1 EF-hand calcium-binding domain containing protein [Entamoeba histolytica HM-3:IMSS]ENY64789.1 EF-hand calcium-binding domain containing protein [Entamoeba histolytica HM-1:IMSS-A]GAT93061.1 EF-hand calcium-binding do|eukprot:XP_656940.1 EF-hand calcium-binding domain containing protein [Entamoeba histolytica HM-1:IMSS]